LWPSVGLHLPIKMLYSIFISGLAALAAAAPVDLKDVKQATDVSYGKYGLYAEYTDYGKYPGGVEKAAKMQDKLDLFILQVLRT
jgi:hypothetical protein